MANSRKSNSDKLTCEVAARIATQLPSGSSIQVGLSGGVDSVVLLHLLHRLAPDYAWQISALHVHHGISPNADDWAGFCARLCARLAIPLHIERVDISPLRALGIEAAARTLRHAAFARQACDFTALGHHADDQVETLFLQLLRGAGVRGAGSMPVLSPLKLPLIPTFRLNAGHTLRPLLHCSRDEITAYAITHGLEWIEDESNLDEGYPRNFLRHQLLPLLGEKFPVYRDTLTRSAAHFAEASVLLDEFAAQDMQGDALKVSVLQALNPPRAKNLLRYHIYKSGAPMPQAVQLDDMLHQLCNAREDAALCVLFGDGAWQVRRYQGLVHVLRTLGEFDRKLVLTWQGEEEMAWPASGLRIRFRKDTGQGISLAKLQGASVSLRLRQGGEALKPFFNTPTRTLKNLLQEQCIAPWLRERLPLLYCEDELICVPGVAIAADYQASADEAGVSMLIDPAPVLPL